MGYSKHPANYHSRYLSTVDLHYDHTATSHCSAFSTTTSIKANPYYQPSNTSLKLPQLNITSIQWPLPSSTSPTWQTTTFLLARDHHQHALCPRFLPNKCSIGQSLHLGPAPALALFFSISSHLSLFYDSTQTANHWRHAKHCRIDIVDVRHPSCITPRTTTNTLRGSLACPSGIALLPCKRLVCCKLSCRARPPTIMLIACIT